MCGGFERVYRGVGVCGVGEAEFFGFFASVNGEFAREFLAAVADGGGDIPVFFAVKGFDFALAFDDHAQRGRLYAAGGEAGADFAPQERREVEADEVVQRAPCLLCVHQVHFELARVGDGLLDGVLGDFVEGNAVDVFVIERAAFAQDFAQVPGDGFAFAIGVRCEVDVFGGFRRFGDFVDVAGVALDDFVVHGEVVGGIDRAVFRDEVTHVAVGGHDFVVFAEVFVQGFGFCRGFDDEEVFAHGWLFVPVSQERRWNMPPGNAATRPSSSNIISMAEISAGVKSRRATRSSTRQGSKPIASSSGWLSLSVVAAAGGALCICISRLARASG